MANLESRTTGLYILSKLIPGRKTVIRGGAVALAWAASVFAPLDLGWYSVKTEHAAVVTDRWTGERTIVGQGNHFKSLWAAPILNAIMTDVDEHFLKEHIWYFRNQGGTTRTSRDRTLENYVDVSSKDLKQLLVRVGVKYEIVDLRKFAISRAGPGLDQIDEHDRPYVLTGNEFDTYIFAAVQSKTQAQLLKSGDNPQKGEVQNEILSRLRKSDMEERYGIKITAVVYDARLPEDVAKANTEKQRNILLGEGFKGRGQSDAEGWKQRLYSGALGIEKNSALYKLSIPELMEKYPKYAPLMERYISGFIQWNVLKDRDKDIMVIPQGTPLTLTPPSK